MIYATFAYLIKLRSFLFAEKEPQSPIVYSTHFEVLQEFSTILAEAIDICCMGEFFECITKIR